MSFLYKMKNFLNISIDNRIIGLDVMRSIAILIVIFGHYINYFQDHLYILIPKTGISIYKFLVIFITGFDGVDLFFVLSGFLIGNSILSAYQNKKLNFKYLISNFWVKRWFRTIPNYLFVLILLILINFLIENRSDSLTVPYFYYFLFIQNIFSGGLSFFAESWSLSIEEWFYISFPFILTTIAYISNKNEMRKFILFVFILCFILVGIAIRFNNINHFDFNDVKKLNWNTQIRTAVLMRIDAIVYGVLMAYFKIYYINMFHKFRYLLLSFGCFILLTAFYFMFLNNNDIQATQFSYGLYFTCVGLGMSLLLPFFFYLKINNSTLINSFTFISVISYSLYLVNYSLVQINIENSIISNSVFSCFIKLLLSLLFTLVISIVLFKFIETPIMNLRKKILNE